jgi:hypothetical protein
LKVRASRAPRSGPRWDTSRKPGDAAAKNARASAGAYETAGVIPSREATASMVSSRNDR